MKWVLTGFVTVVSMIGLATSSGSSYSDFKSYSDSKSDSDSATTAAPGEKIVIPTRFGYIRGERLPTKKGHYVDYFKGVPFAEKPERLKVGQVRLSTLSPLFSEIRPRQSLEWYPGRPFVPEEVHWNHPTRQCLRVQ